MDFIEKARLRLEHWITHNDHHQYEYEMFAEQLALQRHLAFLIQHMVYT